MALRGINMTNKEELFCEDAISRQQALDIVKFEEKWLKDVNGNNPNTDIAFSGIMAKVAKLPLVTPTRKNEL